MSTATDRQVSEARRYLDMLSAAAPPGSLFDIRHRTNNRRFGQLFLHTGDKRAAWRVATLGQRTDVYVGCAARTHARGRREDIASTALLWADCDTPAALAAARSFILPPTMLVASGGAGHGHAYWSLTTALKPDRIEDANRRLARILHADPRCADATRILRPPGTLNHKLSAPTPVHLLEHSRLRHEPAEMLSALTACTTRLDRDPYPPRHLNPLDHHDPLQQIAPRHYVRLLTGREPNREGKIACPFHDDRTPSLHAYPTPERGWTCFGCTWPDGKPLGGDIYTLASLLWHIPTRGASFFDLQHRLDDAFAIRRHDRRATAPDRDNAVNLAPAIER